MLDIRTVLCPVDLGALSERTVAAAGAVAERFGARVVLHHNLDAGPPGFLGVSWMWSEDHDSEQDDKVTEAGPRLRELLSLLPPGVDREARLTRGPLEETILELAVMLDADVLVVSTHGRSDVAHSSLSEKLVSGAPCTVLVLGESCGLPEMFPDDASNGLKVLVPADLEVGTPEVLALLDSLSQTVSAEVHLLHVLPRGSHDLDRAAFTARDRLLDLVPDALKGRVHIDVRFGEPATEIVRAACEHGAVFIMMAAHKKRSLLRLLFGDNALEVLHESPCPVWFVPVNWSSRTSVGKDA